MDKEIGLVGTERTNAIKVSVKEWKGGTFVDIRNWFKNKAGEWCPTQKGLFVPKEHISELITMVERAEAELAAQAKA